MAGTPTGSMSSGSQLGVSRYDRVAGLIVALLILLGAAVALMFVLWLTANLQFRPRPIPVRQGEKIAGRGDHAPGFERDMEAPGFEEMPELMRPELDTALEAVTEATSAVSAALDILDTMSTITTRGEARRGDNRPAGPEGEGEDIIPRWERWEIRWTTTSLPGYANQLDSFGIELGAMGGRDGVDYASQLRQTRPSSRTGPSKNEKRLYMTWRSGRLVEFDRRLLNRAGILTDNRQVAQFYPQVVEDTLATIELEHAGGRSVKEIRKTVFGVRPAGLSSFEFYVIEQRYRTISS